MSFSAEPYRLRGHIVSPRSVINIREAAAGVRKVLNLPEGGVPLPGFLESLSEFGITVDVIDDEDFTLMMAGVEAMCVPETATIALTTSTYKAARRNDPRTRFTIFHELGHFVLQHTKALGRRSVEAKRYIDSEWQADQFSAEITMPLDVIRNRRLLTPSAVSNFFGVSQPAATFRLQQLRRKNEIP